MKDDFIKDINRRKSVIRWVKDVMYKEGVNLNEIRVLLVNNERDKAFKKFVSLMKYVMDSDDALKTYPIQDTIDVHGINATMKTLYSEIVLKPLGKKLSRKTKNVKVKSIDAISQEEIKEDKNVFFGINRNQEREKARLQAIVVHGKIQYQLRSLKTGRTLSQTKTVKDKIKELENS